MKRLVMAILALLFGSVARADINTGFEQPHVFGAPVGNVLSGQDGWYNPVAGSQDFLAFTYLANQFGIANNPQGSVQFVAGLSNGDPAVARAQRNELFGAADTWTISVDMAPKYLGALPATNNLGSFSLQDSTLARSFVGLLTWTNPASPTSWQLGYLVYDAAGVQAPQPGLFAGPQWQNLLANRWYRVSTTFSLSANRILTVSIKDLTTLVTATARPTGWYLTGGVTPTLPIPSAVRLFAGGTTPGNVTAWDNMDVCPLQVFNVNPPVGQEGTIVQIDGCGFGINPDDLSVAISGQNGVVVPLTVLSATDTVIIAKVGPVPFDSQPGQIAVARGIGLRGMNTPLLDDVIPENPTAILVWDRAGARALSPNFFFPVPTLPPVGQSWLLGNRIGFAVMEMTVSGVWRPNSSLRVITKLQETVLGIGSDVEETEIRLRCGGDAFYLAERIKEAVQRAYATRGINTSCVITNAGVNTWKVTLGLLDAVFLPVPIDFGVFTVVVTEPSLVAPFAIGPVTGFYQSFLTQVGLTAKANNIDLTGEDGASISPIIPSTVGVRTSTEPIVLDVAGESFTVRDWGTINGATANQLLGTGKLVRAGAFFDVFADFSPIGTGQARIEVWHNAALVGSAILANGQVGLVASAGSGLPDIVGCGARPQVGLTAPFVWIDFDRLVTITPTGGPPLLGHQIRLYAVAPADTVTNIQALDIAAGLADPSDAGSVVLFNSYEGGICYGNCDGSLGTPRLTANDFTCFINLFATGAPAANCDGSTGTPVLTGNDFLCFINEFAGGCP